MTPEKKQQLFRDSEWFDEDPIMNAMEAIYDNLDGNGDVARMAETIYLMARVIERLQREIRRNEANIDHLWNADH